MIHLVHAHQPGRKLKHVVSKRNDDELRILGTLLDVIRDNGDLERVLVTVCCVKAMFRGG